MTLGHGSHTRSPWWCWAWMLAVSIIALPGAMLAIADDQTPSEPTATETAEDIVVTTAPVDMDADESVIVINATVVTGAANDIRSVVSNWDVLPARVSARRDSLSKRTFLPESGSSQHQIGPPEGAKAFGRSRTVIERDEPIEYVICSQDTRRIIIDKLQQRFAVCALLTDAEDILGGRVQANDQQVVVQQDDAGAQTFENSPGIATEGSVVIESAAVGVAAGRVV